MSVRDLSKTGSILKAIHRLGERPAVLMEVCGTHTVSIFRHGIRELLPGSIRLLSGPGCPVCVTDQGDIDGALSLARRKDTVIATYGDMLRVPGSNTSLVEERSSGHDIRIITSASQCVDLALENPDKEVIFFAVGFETTAPATASLVLEAARKRLSNLSVLNFHKRTPPVLEALVRDPSLRIDGFILPGHVSVILGHVPYSFLAEKYAKPSCIAGFEAEDILLAIADLCLQIRENRPRAASVYPRAVKPEGNPLARDLMDRVFTSGPARWRGIGTIQDSGFVFRKEFSLFDTKAKWNLHIPEAAPPEGCMCGDVLCGKITPRECPLFSTACTPLKPVVPCMVSSEGTCAAYFRFARGGKPDWKK
ncbi:MAG TPA: hydrogenase formation protein HypD [Synergistales bacterium]|nr:hydrogenase formation protein HypD [Synergistales bacterium]